MKDFLKFIYPESWGDTLTLASAGLILAGGIAALRDPMPPLMQCVAMSMFAITIFRAYFQERIMRGMGRAITELGEMLKRDESDE